ncbi:AAA domain-containing protein [Dysgonomonas alginatilytica]|uniref:AAA domain-containing protein n=1 Tax=Dysgonomonas alginatilytica TaxID=1605892 RepID=A0A2V3PTT6_9BACT|nr:AAA family ATPase [Dysgonomonas alginatilytica]PXV66928.1 AAA domain-containing protein [Dysgonomonas alginatilytica]
MEKLFINYFKAFSEELELKIGNKNLLLYGENGAGKSSIYEAIKYIFFQDKIEGLKIRTTITPEEKQQQKNDLKSSYNNKQVNNPFQLKINNTDYDSFNKIDYQVFMISSEDILVKSNISLEDVMRTCYFNIGDTDIFLNNYYDLIESEVNLILKRDFKEDIRISIDNSDNFKCIIIDDPKNLRRKEELKNYFNEAKLNLIILLLLFTIIHIAEDSSKKRLLILDDFVTSMDASNRTYLINHVLSTFCNFQKIILTHNISFYNLIMFVINEINIENPKWDFCNLYELNNSHKVYQKSLIEKVSCIRTDFNAGGYNITELGNRIRKKIEILLYEFSKLMMIGAVEESKNILSSILNDKSIYYDNNKTGYDLINDVKIILADGNDRDLRNRICNKIDSYGKINHSQLKSILKNLKLYQKVTMHPLSHATIGLTTFTVKEIIECLDLLEKIESNLKGCINGNVVNL